MALLSRIIFLIFCRDSRLTHICLIKASISAISSVARPSEKTVYENKRSAFFQAVYQTFRQIFLPSGFLARKTFFPDCGIMIRLTEGEWLKDNSRVLKSQYWGLNPGTKILKPENVIQRPQRKIGFTGKPPDCGRFSWLCRGWLRLSAAFLRDCRVVPGIRRC